MLVVHAAIFILAKSRQYIPLPETHMGDIDMKIKATVAAISLTVFAMSAQSAVLCESRQDPSFQTWQKGYSCPVGFRVIANKPRN
jgi:hypothetical protein